MRDTLVTSILWIVVVVLSLILFWTYALDDAAQVTIRESVASVPTVCWLVSALVAYLLLCWTVIGPRYTRWYYRVKLKNGSYYNDKTPLEIVWFFAPVWVLFWYPALTVYYAFYYGAYRFGCWVIYGTNKW